MSRVRPRSSSWFRPPTANLVACNPGLSVFWHFVPAQTTVSAPVCKALMLDKCCGGTPLDGPCHVHAHLQDAPNLAVAVRLGNGAERMCIGCECNQWCLSLCSTNSGTETCSAPFVTMLSRNSGAVAAAAVTMACCNQGKASLMALSAAITAASMRQIVLCRACAG